MGMIGVLVSFFKSRIGWRARAQDFSPTLPRATKRTIDIPTQILSSVMENMGSVIC